MSYCIVSLTYSWQLNWKIQNTRTKSSVHNSDDKKFYFILQPHCYTTQGFITSRCFLQKKKLCMPGVNYSCNFIEAVLYNCVLSICDGLCSLFEDCAAPLVKIPDQKQAQVAYCLYGEKCIFKGAVSSSYHITQITQCSQCSRREKSYLHLNGLFSSSCEAYSSKFLFQQTFKDISNAESRLQSYSTVNKTAE